METTKRTYRKTPTIIFIKWILSLGFILLSFISFAATTLATATSDGTAISTTTIGVVSSSMSANTNGATSEYGFVYHTAAVSLTSGTATNPNTLGTVTTTAGSIAISTTWSATLSGLTACTKYWVYPYVKIGANYYYRTTALQVFTLHSITTGSASNINVNFATFGGTVTAGGAGVTISAKGVVYGTSANPILSSSVVTHSATASGAYSVVLNNLIGATTYYVRAYVTNNAGTSYGSDVTFTTSTPPTVTYSSLPFTDDFASSLGTNWATSVTSGSSVMAIVNAGGAWPLFGSTTDASSTATAGNGFGVYNTSAVGGNQKQMAYLGLNLLNKTGITLDFPIVDWGTGGGVGQYWDSLMVYLSVDGGYVFGNTGTYVPLNQAPYMDGIWNNLSIDISALATANSLTPSATSVVKLVFNLAGSNDVTKPKNTGIANSQMVYIDNFKAANTGTLPVNLLSFTGLKSKEANLLNWSTASEINNDHFEVERSEDGQYFENIGFISGQGTSYQINNYSFVDSDNHYAMAYYRLKQVDFDGVFTYSNAISINNAQTISLYKSGDNSILLTGENLNTIQFFDVNGKMIYSTPLNKNTSTQILYIDAASFSEELYLVKVLGWNEVFSQKLIY